MATIEQVLERYGLDKKETSLFLASLALGESGMTALSKRAQLKRSTAYLVFKSLETKGLMGSFKMRDGMHFVATQPDALLTKARRQMIELEEVLPGMKALTASSPYKPRITSYEGREGYMIAVEDSLRKSGTILRHIGSLSGVHKMMGEDYDIGHYLPERIKKNIFLRALYFPDLSARIRNRDHSRELRELRYLPMTHSFNSSALIYENKVVLASTEKELVAVVIESEELALAERKKFDLIWDLVGPSK